MPDEKKIMCPFSGKVTDIGCKTGDRVSEGQIVFRIEALDNMNIDVAASFSGDIDRILVRSGEQVEAGWTLAILH